MANHPGDSNAEKTKLLLSLKGQSDRMVLSARARWEGAVATTEDPPYQELWLWRNLDIVKSLFSLMALLITKPPSQNSKLLEFR